MKPAVQSDGVEQPAGLVTECQSVQAPPRPERPDSAVVGSTRAGKLDHLDVAYREFCRRRAEGESLDADSFCGEFPSMRNSLRKLLQAQLYLEENSHLVADPVEIHWPAVGESFLGNHLKMELGKGAFARVYLAMEPKLGNRLVAVKVALHGGAEAEILGRIRHPNIVPVHSVKEDPVTGVTAVCMPYLGGATLMDVQDRAFATSAAPPHASTILDAVREIPYPLDPAFPAAPAPVLQNGTYVDGVRLIGAQLADALAFIHERGIYHRDLKPSNVLMTPEGVPMLLDFNLSADVDRAADRLGGTILYMSPEQLEATDPASPPPTVALDARSDIYSLGVILYELVTGKHPFAPPTLNLTSAQLRNHLAERQQHAPVEARRLNPNIDTAFGELIQRCLAHDANARPQSAVEIAKLLRRDLVQTPRAPRWIRRHPVLAAAAFLIAVLGLGSVSFAVFRSPSGETASAAGMRLYQEGQFAAAVQQFNSALQADPEDHAAYFARARAHQQLGDFNLAIQGYQATEQRQPNGRNHAAMAYCLNRLGGLADEAIKHNDTAIKGGFATAEVHNNIAFSCLEVNKRKEARENLDRALELDPKLASAHHNRARLALAEAFLKLGQLMPGGKSSDAYGQLQAGINDIRKAIALGPPSAELYFDAARLCALSARIERSWVPDGIAYLEQSMDHGADPGKRHDLSLKTLAEDPRFQKLADRPAGKPFPPTLRIVDPIIDRAP